MSTTTQDRERDVRVTAWVERLRRRWLWLDPYSVRQLANLASAQEAHIAALKENLRLTEEQVRLLEAHRGLDNASLAAVHPEDEG